MEITLNDIPSLLTDFFSPILNLGVDTATAMLEVTTIVDRRYSTITKAEVLSAIRTNPLLVKNLQDSINSELRDCDDYALQLKASITALYRNKSSINNSILPPAIAIVITQGHALNLVVCDINRVATIFLVDPSDTKPALIADKPTALRVIKGLPIKLIYI